MFSNSETIVIFLCTVEILHNFWILVTFFWKKIGLSSSKNKIKCLSSTCTYTFKTGRLLKEKVFCQSNTVQKGFWAYRLLFVPDDKITVHKPQCFEFEQTCIIQLGYLKEAVATHRAEELSTFHKRPGRLSQGGRCNLSFVPHGETTRKTDHLGCGTISNIFFQPMMCCINFCFEFYFPKCTLKEHLQVS